MSVMRVVAGLWIDNTTGRCFMQRRAQGRRCPGMWEWPGGKVEDGENDLVALHREWGEELGVNIYQPTSKPIAVGSLTAPDAMTLALYPVTLRMGSPAPQILDGQLELAWVEPCVAVSNLACTPMTYNLYQVVQAYVDRVGHRR
jgi:8-oxo-dGTP diphosphatase